MGGSRVCDWLPDVRHPAAEAVNLTSQCEPLAKSSFSILLRFLHNPCRCAGVVAAEVEAEVAVALADQ